MQKNNDKYIDKFPVNETGTEFTSDNIETWKEENSIPVDATAEEVTKTYKEKYGIKKEKIEDVRKIIAVRYGIEKEGYSAMKGYIISKEVSEKSIAVLEESNSYFPGIAITIMPIRNYQYGNLASHIIGYIGPIGSDELKKYKDENYGINDYIGKMGVESVFEKYLRGDDGIKQVDMSIDGTRTGEYVTKEATAGSDVILTIDANLQKVTEESLKNNIEKIRSGGFGTKSEAHSGAAVVLNTKTGEILAMASYPDYEPELFLNGISTEKWKEYTEGTSALMNRTIQNSYAPGSIFKMATAIAGLETEKISRTEQVNDVGIYNASKDYKPRCWIYSSTGGGHGRLNVSGAIKHSCNYYFYEVATRTGIEAIEKYATYFGLGEKTNVELPGEVSGTLAGKSLYSRLGRTWYYGDTLSAAIGQSENSFTPLQMAKYIAMLTNGGKDIDVTILKKIVDVDGNEIDKKEIEEYVNSRLGLETKEKKDLNISQENLDAVLEGMRSVTTETGGTAYSIFKNFEIEVGGKTGSSEAGKNVNAWFAGFAPYDDPEIAVVVFVENGGHGYYTAEVLRDVVEEYFGLNEEVEEDRTAISYTQKTN